MSVAASRTPDVRFDEKIYRETKTGCWLWLGRVQADGYAQFWVDGGETPAHRFSYERANGPIPVGMTLDHYRLNPGPRRAPCSRSCVNPTHLELATQRENTLRGNGPSALNARRTICKNGHPFNRDNTRKKVRTSGRAGRRCAACSREQSRRYKAKRRAAS